MNTFFRFVGLFSPNKRRRTAGPGTPTQQSSSEHAHRPVSEPQDRKARAALQARVGQKDILYADTRFGPGSRKRERDKEDSFDVRDERNYLIVNSDKFIVGAKELEQDDEESSQIEDKGEIEYDESSDKVSPEDSASQITPVEDSEDELEGEENLVEFDNGADDGNEEVENDSLEGVLWQADEETTAQRKVQEYLARQAELMSRQEEFKKHIAGGQWHPDELYLFDRLSMRSFEPIFPMIWQLDLPTLNPALFSNGKTFFNTNHAGRDYGESSQYSNMTWLILLNSR